MLRTQIKCNEDIMKEVNSQREVVTCIKIGQSRFFGHVVRSRNWEYAGKWEKPREVMIDSFFSSGHR